MNGETTLTGVMGWPIAHSFSPQMHNAAFAALGLNWAYVPLPVHPDRVREAVSGLRALGFAGANVTIPHKVAVMALMDTITDRARLVGAVNTIKIDDAGRFHGDNTDVPGFLSDLRAHGVEIGRGMRALILGAGGAARAAVAALTGEGAEVIIANRTLARAESLAETFGASAMPLSEVGGFPDPDLIVNATSVGMWPDVDASPWPEGGALPANVWIYDMVYRPERTKLLQCAGERGIGGIGMLVRQGAIAFEWWTGTKAPVAIMMDACRSALG
jgi:shikimate dehydrogenase